MKWKTLIKIRIWVWCTYCFSTFRVCEMCPKTLLRVTMVKFIVISDIEGPMARWRRSQNYSFVVFRVKRQVDVTSLTKIKNGWDTWTKKNYSELWFTVVQTKVSWKLWVTMVKTVVLYQKLYQKLWNFDLLWEKLFWLFFILLNTFKYNSFEYWNIS